VLVVFAFALLALEIPQTAAQTEVYDCRWDGTSPFCDGECGAGETEIPRLATPPGGGAPPAYHGPRFGAACATGTKALYCKASGVTCRWRGTAPFCAGECRNGETQANPPPGSSSGSGCVTGSKVYCCSGTGGIGSPLTGPPTRGSWTWLGGAFSSPPAVVSWAPNRLDIFGLGDDRAMYQKTWDGSQWLPSF
jgi:hypothetical protein